MTLPAKFWMMIPWGRVGSNLLLNNIKQMVGSGRCTLINENFNVMPSIETQLAWIGDFYGASTDLDLVGCKQSILSVGALDRVGSLLADLGIALIRVRRANFVKVAISQLRAELFAEKSLLEIGAAKWGVRHGREPLGPAPLDPNRFLEIAALARSTDDLLAGFTPKTPTLDIEYRQLQADSVQVARAACEWLGLSVSRSAKPAFVKATPDDLDAAVPNLRSLREALSESPLHDLAPMFDE